MPGEPTLQRLDHLSGVINAQCGLRDIGQPGGILRPQHVDIFNGRDHGCSAFYPPKCSFDLRVSMVADDNDLKAFS